VYGFSLSELFALGGIFMWPLLFFSIAALAIIIERSIFLIYHDLKMDDMVEDLRNYIEDKKLSEAIPWLEDQGDRRMGARILLALVRQANSGEHIMEKSAEAEAAKCVNSLENGFSFLTALGSVAPLTGFLGTVSGMIGAFRTIAEAEDVSAQIVANGIYEALITTVFGLIIAIAAMVFHSIASHTVDRFAANVESACSELIIDLTLGPDKMIRRERRKKKGRDEGDEEYDYELDEDDIHDDDDGDARK
jgi:biopolymer transport protein ExbB